MVASGLAALFLTKFPRVATATGAGGVVVGCLLGFLPALKTLIDGTTTTIGPLAWNVPLGSFAVALDPLSAVFVLAILALSGLSAVYGAEYLLGDAGKKSLGAPWFFFNLLVASMVMVALARNGILFLVSWELMSISSFFLVTYHDEDPAVRDAGKTYLIAVHIGTAFLLVFFALLGREAGSLDFDKIAAIKTFPPYVANILFLLAVVGFGTKAGFMPLHVWLPDAHPAAPSHVSAVMSGVMVKTGVYGILRTLTFLPVPPVWWGWLLIGIGMVSGVMGILFALAQNDLKRLLAYSTVENVGIIAMAIGVGILGVSSGTPLMAIAGYTGALLHVVNHAMFKGLLFLGAGAVLHGTGTRRIDRLGGLLKIMPWVGSACAIGALAISGLPPLNGFIGEFLVYFGAFRAERGLPSQIGVPAMLALGSLAMIGGLTAVCFSKVIGIVFLGSPRSEEAEHAHAPGPLMTIPIVILAAGCVLLGAFANWVVPPFARVALDTTKVVVSYHPNLLAEIDGAVGVITNAALAFFAILLTLGVVRLLLLSKREVGTSGTWGCGYAAPTARMQYTASSFVEPVTTLFDPLIRTRTRLVRPTGLFPKEGSLATETPDIWMEGVYLPLFRGIHWVSSRLRWLQQGRVQVYILYVTLTIVGLLVWYLGLSNGR